MNLRSGFGGHSLVLSAFNERLAVVIDKRLLTVCCILLVLSGLLVLVALACGQLSLPLAELLDVVGGKGSGRSRMVVLEWRLPRAVGALVLGGLLGLAGAVFQSLTRNPLGSPDIVGFDAGSYTGAILAIIFFGGSWPVLAGFAVAGGLATASIVYMLTWQNGIRGFQLIVIGIGISATLTALNQWILIMSDLTTAMSATHWSIGTLGRINTEQLALLLWLAIPVTVATLFFGRSLRLMEIGDSRAKSLGVRLESSRLLLMLLAVTAMALVVAIAGPIPFVALAAPQIAHILTRTAGTTLAGAMTTGALLLLTSDFIAQHAFSPMQLPVGVVTLCFGGLYFLWQIIKEGRSL